MNPTALLSLISDLYTQVSTLQARIAELENQAPPQDGTDPEWTDPPEKAGPR